MEGTMNMSRLDITREKSRIEDRSRNDETSFMRPATPLKTSQVQKWLKKMSNASRSKKSYSIRNADPFIVKRNTNGKPEAKQEFEYAFQSRPRIRNDFK